MNADSNVLRKLRDWSNTTRPVRTAVCVQAETAGTTVGEMSVELHRGQASSGHQSNYARRETWWVVAQVTNGTRRYVRGSRFCGATAQQRALREYASAVASMNAPAVAP